MKKIGAEILIGCLKEQGVKTVFGYPGGTVLDIYDALYRDGKIRHVITAHEQGAAHAADAYARTTGRTGVVIATSDQPRDGACDRFHGFRSRRCDYGKRGAELPRTGFLSGNRHHGDHVAHHQT